MIKGLTALQFNASWNYAYIIQCGGWGCETIIKTVYKHELKERELEMNQKANDY